MTSFLRKKIYEITNFNIALLIENSLWKYLFTLDRMKMCSFSVGFFLNQTIPCLLLDVIFTVSITKIILPTRTFSFECSCMVHSWQIHNVMTHESTSRYLEVTKKIDHKFMSVFCLFHFFYPNIDSDFQQWLQNKFIEFTQWKWVIEHLNFSKRMQPMMFICFLLEF